eukprot:13919656-Alexandrium_andersonii.AAC.1
MIKRVLRHARGWPPNGASGAMPPPTRAFGVGGSTSLGGRGWLASFGRAWAVAVLSCSACRLLAWPSSSWRRPCPNGPRRTTGGLGWLAAPLPCVRRAWAAFVFCLGGVCFSTRNPRAPPAAGASPSSPGRGPAQTAWAGAPTEAVAWAWVVVPAAA